MKYRKRPVIIEALKFDPTNINEIKLFVGENLICGEANIPVFSSQPQPYIIKTLKDDMIVSRGDYIIKGIKGELYPCKSDIFEQTYEKIEDGENN